VAADFDGDGIPDLAVVSGAHTVSILLDNGDGTFRAPVSYQVGSRADSIAVADFTRNGVLDLAVGDSDPNTKITSILLGNGDGTFQDAINFPGYNFGLTVGDFNGDGIPDLVNIVGQIYFGNGDGTFRLAGNNGSNGQGLAVGDFDGNGTADIAMAEGGQNTVRVLLGNGDGTFKDPVDYPVDLQPTFVASGDFDGDGTPDLAVSNYTSQTVSVLLGNGDGTFKPAVSYPVGSGALQVTVGDFDGDGTPDLAVACKDNVNLSVSVLLGNGDGTFQPATQYPAGSAGNAAGYLAVGDFNADSFPDLAVNNYDTGTVSVLINAADWSGPMRPSSPEIIAEAALGPTIESAEPAAPMPLVANTPSQPARSPEQVEPMDRFFVGAPVPPHSLVLPALPRQELSLIDDSLWTAFDLV
jgi:hypothetical protein